MEVEKPGVIVPGSIDNPPPYGVARPPKACRECTFTVHRVEYTCIHDYVHVHVPFCRKSTVYMHSNSNYDQNTHLHVCTEGNAAVYGQDMVNITRHLFWYNYNEDGITKSQLFLLLTGLSPVVVDLVRNDCFPGI